MIIGGIEFTMLTDFGSTCNMFVNLTWTYLKYHKDFKCLSKIKSGKRNTYLCTRQTFEKYQEFQSRCLFKKKCNITQHSYISLYLSFIYVDNAFQRLNLAENQIQVLISPLMPIKGDNWIFLDIFLFPKWAVSWSNFTSFLF